MGFLGGPELVWCAVREVDCSRSCFNLCGKRSSRYSGGLDATVAVLANSVFTVAEEVEQEHDDNDEACNSSYEDAPAEAFTRAQRGYRYADDCVDERGQEQEGKNIPVSEEWRHIHTEAGCHETDSKTDVGAATVCMSFLGLLGCVDVFVHGSPLVGNPTECRETVSFW